MKLNHLWKTLGTSLLAAACLANGVCNGAENDGFQSLFNGKDLSG